MSARKKFSAKVYKAILALHKDCCAACKCKLTALTGCEWDHIKELWNGGEDVPDNLQPLCFTCHEAKSAKGRTEQAKADRVKLNNLGVDTSKGPPIKSRGFPKRAKPEPKPLPPRQSLYRDVSNA